MVPGFAERLQEELKKLAPPTVTIEVCSVPRNSKNVFIVSLLIRGTKLDSLNIFCVVDFVFEISFNFKKFSIMS